MSVPIPCLACLLLLSEGDNNADDDGNDVGGDDNYDYGYDDSDEAGKIASFPAGRSMQTICSCARACAG
eukprot:scaffold236409_cov22-Tisochrysis_lutea.AAC.1